jgi:hypothetical protein
MSNTPDRDYELIVKKLLETKLQKEGLANLTAYHLKKYKGKSGQMHEIDVSFEVKVGELELLFLAECKHYSRRVGADDIMAFSFRMQDIGAHKGLIVTTAGFQAGAVTVAKTSRIALVIVAAGRIKNWWNGFMPSLFEFGFAALEVSVSSDGADLELFGRRRIVCNQTWSLTRLSGRDPVPDKDVNGLTFLPSDEENRLDPPADLNPITRLRSSRRKRLDDDDIPRKKDRLV